jgi:coenzyme F420 hydrogenase subunit beta
MIDQKACQELISEVIKKDLCTLCGACVGLCPYFTAYNGRVVLKDRCDLVQGRCSTFCPRISLDLGKISKATFGVPYAWHGIGTYREILMVRSTDTKVKARAQDAGTVTTLFCFAKEEGFIDSAVLTFFKDKSSPKGAVVSTGEEILACAGSSYIATPTVEAFNRGAQDGDRRKFGFVGTPCQVLALAKMKDSTLRERNPIDKVGIVIGLFCTWALSHPDFAYFLEREVSDPVVKYDIPPHPANVLKVYTEKQLMDIPLEKVLPFVRPACQVCHDLTAEFADISVGSGRGEVLEWNTVIIRTSRGMDILKGAEKKGLIEIREIPKENLTRLEGAALNKKKRALKNIIQRTGSADDLLYLNVQAEVVKQFLAE